MKFRSTVFNILSINLEHGVSKKTCSEGQRKDEELDIVGKVEVTAVEEMFHTDCLFSFMPKCFCVDL